jgi:hypothetical protein
MQGSASLRPPAAAPSGPLPAPHAAFGQWGRGCHPVAPGVEADRGGPSFILSGTPVHSEINVPANRNRPFPDRPWCPSGPCCARPGPRACGGGAHVKQNQFLSDLKHPKDYRAIDSLLAQNSCPIYMRMCGIQFFMKFSGRTLYY